MKTTFKKLISNINFEDKSLESQVDWEELASIFNISNLYWSEDERLKSYFIKTWYCTDSWVGIRAYFLDGEFVAISNQMGRKMDEDFGFISIESAKKLREYLISLTEEGSLNVDILEDGFLNEEIDETYKIEYNSQIIHKTGLLKGERVKIIKKHYPHNTEDYFHTVEIQKEDGKKTEIDCRELDFEYNTLN